MSNCYFLPNDNTKYFRIAYVGQIIKRKRVDWLLKGINALPENFKKEIHVEIFGDGPLRNKMESFVREKNISDIVTFKGVKQNSEIRNIYANYDLLILPSIHDGWGAVVNEALLSGAQALVSSRCGSKDLINYSGFGTVFKFDDFDDFQKKLIDIIKNGKLSDVARESIHKWSTEYLHPDNAATYFIEIIEYLSGNISAKPIINWQQNIINL